MRVDDIMSWPAITVPAGSDLMSAMDLMIETGVSGLMVLNEAGKLCGVLSEGDFLRRIEIGTSPPTKTWWSTIFASMDLATAYRVSHGHTVSDLMSESVITIDAEASLSEAASLMETHRIKRIAVMSAGVLVGVISRSDFVKALLAAGRETRAGNVGDEAIKRHVLRELRLQPWTFGCSIDVFVVDGYVTLDGDVTTRSQKGAARAAAEGANGVRGVDNLLRVFESPLAEAV